MYWPGEEGRVIVSGHRTTYGAPFWDLDKLQAGDRVTTTTKWGTFEYIVTKTSVVDDDEPVPSIRQPGRAPAHYLQPEVLRRPATHRLRRVGGLMTEPNRDPKPSGKWKRRGLELALWAAVAIITALLLIYASDRWLPANF